MIKQVSLVLAVLLLGSSATLADTQYNDTSQVNSAIEPFGNPNTATYGERFSAPVTDTTLNDFSLFLNAGSTGPLEGYIGTWAGSEVGAILFTSAPVTATGASQQFTFDTGGLSLIAGGEYIAFISISGANYSSFIGTASMPTASFGTIPGGEIEYLNNGSDTSQFTNGSWDPYGADAEFIADFSQGSSPVPEPGSLLLFGTGLMGFAGALRRKFAL